jgi:signal transduction histidine kinase
MSKNLEPGTMALAHWLECRRAEVMVRYGEYLNAGRSTLAAEQDGPRHALVHASEVLDEVIESLRTGEEITNAGSRLPKQIGEKRALDGVRPLESLRAAAALFKIITTTLADCPDAQPKELAFAVLTLNQSMSSRINDAASSYSAYVLHKLHQAQADERQHLSRDLHDRVSAGINVAYRQLELYDIRHAENPALADQRVESARDALRQSMQEIRKLIAGLRPDGQLEDLKQSLRRYLDSLGEDVSAEIAVSGDESWVKPEVRDQVFLILREAIRNALRHGHASIVFVRVIIAPHELWATVDDNGAGFDPETCGLEGGSGVRYMEERATLLGGSLRVSSSPGKGTNVEICVPLAQFGDRSRVAG